MGDQYADVRAEAPSRPKQNGKQLSLTIRVDDNISIAQVLSEAEKLGEVIGLGLHPYYGDLY